MKVNRMFYPSLPNMGWFFGFHVVAASRTVILGIGSGFNWSYSGSRNDKGERVFAACYGPFTLCYHG